MKCVLVIDYQFFSQDVLQKKKISPPVKSTDDEAADVDGDVDEDEDEDEDGDIDEDAAVEIFVCGSFSFGD